MKKIMDNKKTLVQDMLEGYVKHFQEEFGY